MDLTKLTTEELLEELKRRSETKDKNKTVLVFGTIGIDGGSNFVEVFKEIKTEKDLNFLTQVSLRSRFNPHRYYQGFYFKTNEFGELEKNLKKDNEKFADWVRGCSSVKYIRL